jgi:hypothetical protein
MLYISECDDILLQVFSFLAFYDLLKCRILSKKFTCVIEHSFYQLRTIDVNVISLLFYRKMKRPSLFHPFCFPTADKFVSLVPKINLRKTMFIHQNTMYLWVNEEHKTSGFPLVLTEKMKKSISSDFTCLFRFHQSKFFLVFDKQKIGYVVNFEFYFDVFGVLQIKLLVNETSLSQSLIEC